MRYSVKQVLIFATIAILSSCAKEVLEPQQMISGDYALDDGSQVSNTYLHFENGYVIEMVASAKKTFAENYFWGCSKNDFVQKTRSSYTIQNGELITSGKNMGAISQDGDVMTLGGKKYSVLKGFKVEYYSKIVLASTSGTATYVKQSSSFACTIDNPVQTSTLAIACPADWISNIKFTGEAVTFDIAENTSSSNRLATFTMKYAGARDVTYVLTQNWAASGISLTPSTKEFTYTGGNGSFTYSIENPRDGASVIALSGSDWITNVSVSGNTVSYKVASLSSVFAREGTIKVKYKWSAGSVEKAFLITQKGSPVTSLTLNKSSVALTAGGSEALVAGVTPSDAELKWASDHPEFAKVDANGKVTAVDGGNTIITVSAGGKTASCTVTVKDRSNNLNVTPSWTESIGLTYGNTGTITISNPSGGTLSISSQPSSSIATASLSGTKVNIMPVSSGETSITIKSAKTTGYAEATKTVTIKVLKATPTMTLSATSLEIAPSWETDEISVTTNSDDALSASSSNTSVATVSVSGKIVTVKSKSIEGDVIITVTCAETGKYKGISKEVTVKVKTVVPDLVDLGLSVKWAKCNLGASKPEKYGSYYQWAGTKDVTDNSIYLYWDNCPYHSGSSYSSSWTKYIPSGMPSYWSGAGSPDNKTVLDPEDDVAHVKLGGKWRIPTRTEWEELRRNCNWRWTTQNGIKGYKVTSMKSGYTSKSIFLPAADTRIIDYHPYYDASEGYYWSSSLNTDSPYYAYCLFFRSDDVDTHGCIRCNGLSVRPVSD